MRRRPTAADARRVLERLLMKCSTALASGLAPDVAYMERLDSELGAALDADTRVAVSCDANRLTATACCSPSSTGHDDTKMALLFVYVPIAIGIPLLVAMAVDRARTRAR